MEWKKTKKRKDTLVIAKIIVDYVWWALKRIALGILIVLILAVSLVSCTGFAAYPF